jgi:hypothetical protein
MHVYIKYSKAFIKRKQMDAGQTDEHS